MALELTLLGAPSITRDLRPVEVDTRKAIALLAYLAVTGRPHTRDALCTLLWPEYDHEHARGALRRTLSTLRKALGSEWIETDRERVALRHDPALRIDVDEFRAALASERIERLTDAVELYQGDLLAGFTLRDSVAFDDWQYFEGDSLRRELAGALDRLADFHASRGDYGAAIACARRRLGLNTLDEPAHRRLIELYARNGERAAAVQQYRECVRTLHSELGVAPVEETTNLYRAIQESGFPPPSPGAETRPAVASETAAPEGDAPLVGRSAEWAALFDCYRSVGHDGRLAVIEGEMGIGKSRLADEFLASLGASGVITITVRCHEDERTLAYAPVAEAMRAAVSLLGATPRDAAEELGRLLPEAGPASPNPLDSRGAQTRFFESLRRVLEAAVAGDAPGVVFFDDVHNADEASLDFLTYLARRLRDRPMLVLFTWRAVEVHSTHRLRRLLAENVRARLATIIRPRRLDRQDVEALASAMNDADAQLAASIHRQTAGLPLFVVEYLRAVARGDAESPPDGVRDLLRARLNAVSELAGQVLTAAAVMGTHFDADTVREAGGRTEDETVFALEELASFGLIEEAGDNYDFQHEQLRDLAYADTSLARRRLLHGRVGDALARKTAAAGPLSAQIARHYELAGRDAEAAERFFWAGEHARSVYANADALAYFEAALAFGHPEPGVVHEAVGDLQTLLGHYGAALASYEAAAARAADGHAPALEHKLGGLNLRRGDWELAASHLEAALASAEESDRALRARILADASLVAHRRGDTEDALDTGRQALADAEAAGDDAALAQAHNILGILMNDAGERSEARTHLEGSLRWADERAEPGARIAALNNLALLHRAEGDLDGAIARTREALELCDRVGDRHRQAALHNNLADLLHADGRGDEAMAQLKAAVTIFAEVGEEGEPQPEIWKLVEW
jgi:DNA-binding SARP family transcriptional activator